MAVFTNRRACPEPISVCRGMGTAKSYYIMDGGICKYKITKRISDSHGKIHTFLWVLPIGVRGEKWRKTRISARENGTGKNDKHCAFAPEIFIINDRKKNRQKLDNRAEKWYTVSTSRRGLFFCAVACRSSCCRMVFEKPALPVWLLQREVQQRLSGFRKDLQGENPKFYRRCRKHESENYSCLQRMQTAQL